MFESITENLQNALRKLRGRGRLTEKSIEDGLRGVRTALLQADVNFRVVKDFISKVKEAAVGEEVLKSVSPGQQIIKIVYDELVSLMGPKDTVLKFSKKGPTVIMMAGLQGSGKTTTCGKFAKLLVKKGHHPLLVAADVQRPAAVEQLKVLGKELNIPVYSEDGGRPPKICKRSVSFAKENGRDMIILDTAGRLHIDRELMAELKEITDQVSPHNIFLVCDAMTGQDAVNSAKEFNDQIQLDGIILTKLDGDARGGAALSVKAVTGRPIQYVGIGERLDDLEEFFPDRMAGRILGMGDIVSLVEKAQETLDKEEAEKAAEKLLTNTFTLEDFLDQFQQIKKLGPIKNLLSHLPGMDAQLKEMDLDEKEFTKIEAIIQSMTFEERIHPEIIDISRRNRIARGSGTSTHDVSDLLKQFRQMRKMMKNISQMGGGFLGKLIPGVGGFKRRKMKKIKEWKKKGKKFIFDPNRLMQ